MLVTILGAALAPQRGRAFEEGQRHPSTPFLRATSCRRSSTSNSRRAPSFRLANSPRWRRLSTLPGLTPKRRAASRRSTSSGAGVVGVFASLTRHPLSGSPLRKRVPRAVKVDEQSPTRLHRGNMARLGFSAKPGARDAEHRRCAAYRHEGRIDRVSHDPSIAAVFDVASVPRSSVRFSPALSGFVRHTWRSRQRIASRLVTLPLSNGATSRLPASPNA